MHPSKTYVLAVVLALAALLVALSTATAVAHHGWRWAENGDFVVSGAIISAKLGNPHGIVMLNVNGDEWTIEVGQPWRNSRAGLSDDMFAPGVDMIARGHRSKDATELVLKAERLTFAGKTYDLYPNRD
jgi:hypothetical protein